MVLDDAVREGKLKPGDNIVLVVTASSHRQDAFTAAEFLMDYLKTRAPFWKQEERTQGTAWVAAKDTDEDTLMAAIIAGHGHGLRDFVAQQLAITPT